MDDLDLLLNDLAQEAPPQASLDRIRPRLQATLRRRRVTRFTLAAAALIAVWQLVPPPADIPLPLPGEAIITVPDLVIAAPQIRLSQQRRPKPRMLDENTVQLASTNPNIVILWSLE